MSISAQPNACLARMTAAVVLALALPAAAQAADAGKEVSTAAEHAGYAAGSDTIAKVHLHLHHVINCLVGPDGDAFDQQSGNPCDGQGNGALNDLDSKMADRKSSLEDALALAKTGTQLQSVNAAQTVAKAAKQLLAKSE